MYSRFDQPHPSHPHSLNSSHKALQGFAIKQTIKTKQSILCEDLSGLHKLASPTDKQSARLNTLGLFPFGGESHKTNFPLFIDNFARNLCCFFIDLRTIQLDNLGIEWTSPLLENHIRLELATHFGANHKTADKLQTLFCSIGQTPNQNEAKWTLSLFENVKGKSSPR